MAGKCGDTLVYSVTVLFVWTVVMLGSAQAQDCANCRVLGGMGFATHPDDCARFLQCVPRGNGWNPFPRRCIPSMFWNPNAFACQLPSAVSCLNDPCLGLGVNVPGVRHLEYCGAYWECDQVTRRTVALRCCPEGLSYNNGACTVDVNCVNGCHYSLSGTTTFGCLYSPVQNSPRQFEYRDSIGGVTHTFTCSEGTAWDDNECGCHTIVAVDDPVILTGAACLDLSLPLDTLVGFGDNSGKGPNGLGWYVSAGGVESSVEPLGSANGNAALLCSGNPGDYPSIPRYANLDWTYMRVELRYLLNNNIQGDNRELAIFTNSFCTGVTTISLSVTRDNTQLTARISTDNQVQNNAVTVNPRLGLSSAQANQWVGVTVIYTGETLSITTTNQQTNSQVVGGKIVTSATGLHLCDGNGFREFAGYIDDFNVYLCNPN